MKESTNNNLYSIDEYLIVAHKSTLDALLLNLVDIDCGGFCEYRMVSGTERIEPNLLWSDTSWEVGGVISYSALFAVSGEKLLYKCMIAFNAVIDCDDISVTMNYYEDDLWRTRKKHPVNLNRYLVRKMYACDVGDTASAILNEYCHDFLKNDKPVSPTILAERLGLGILELRLDNMNTIRSILVLEDSSYRITVRGGTAVVDVPANTIVINSSIMHYDGMKSYLIAHECYHFAAHELFRTFQHVAVKYCRHSSHKMQPDAEKSLEWLEIQANIGASYLRYPREIARTDLERIESVRDQHFAHAGEKYENGIKNIAMSRGISPSVIKNVYKYERITPVNGALNYANGRKVNPFAFNTSNFVTGDTFVINLWQLDRILKQNAALLDAFSKGLLLYVEGHVVVNSSRYVVDMDGYYELTGEALCHIDECCLKFSIKYARTGNGYVSGELHCDEQQFQSVVSLISDAEAMLKMAYEFDEIRKLPFDFAGTLIELMKQRKLTHEKLAERAELHRTTIERIISGESTEYKLDTVLHLAVGLKLNMNYASDFFRKARFPADDSPCGSIIRSAAIHFQEVPIGYIAEFATEISKRYHTVRKSPTLAAAKANYEKLKV